jgi:hypothetical protein
MTTNTACAASTPSAIDGSRNPAPLWPTTSGRDQSQSDGVDETASSTNASGRPAKADERRSGTTAWCPAVESTSATQRHVDGPTSGL